MSLRAQKGRFSPQTPSWERRPSYFHASAKRKSKQQKKQKEKGGKKKKRKEKLKKKARKKARKSKIKASSSEQFGGKKVEISFAEPLPP